MENLKKVIESAQTAGGLKHKVERKVSTLKGDIIRLEGTVSFDDNCVPVKWDSHGELISFNDEWPLDQDRKIFKLIIIEDL